MIHRHLDQLLTDYFSRGCKSEAFVLDMDEPLQIHTPDWANLYPLVPTFVWVAGLSSLHHGSNHRFCSSRGSDLKLKKYFDVEELDENAKDLGLLLAKGH